MTHQPIPEVAIIGAGPIGLELAVALKRQNVNYLHFDAKQIGYTFSWWPRNTPFFSTTERIEIAGVPIPNGHQGRVIGEEYLAYLRAIVEQFDLAVKTYEQVTAIKPHAHGGFSLHTKTLAGEYHYHVKRVVIAKGDMDKPNLLSIQGENLPHVSHYFTDPHFYFRKQLLVIGGKNSAIEAALRCWRSGTEVAISYRQAEFSDRVKAHLLPDINAQIANGNIKFYPETVPLEITPQHVVLQSTRDGELIIHPTDFVLLATGFEADMSLFTVAGVQLEGEFLVPVHNPDTMETNITGIYVAGTAAAGGRQPRYRLFIENSHEHVRKIVTAITGHVPDKIGTIPSRNYELALKEIQAN